MSYLFTILKLLIPSIAIAVAIKYLAPLHPIDPTPIVLGMAILLPPVLLSLYLAIDSREVQD